MAPARPASRHDRRPERWLARRGGRVEFLRLPAFLFGVVGRLRNAGFDRGWLPVDHLEVPVVSIGNLTAGGTGKTPFVAFLARELAARNWRPGIVSRGFRATHSGASDEGRMLDLELGDTLRIEDRVRARGARELTARGADVILLDDGFQHRRLARDLDVVLVDATRPWGLPAPGVRALLPRGLMREPLASLARADLAVLTRVDQVDAERLDALEAELVASAPGLGVLHARHRPVRLVALEPDGQAGGTHALEALTGRSVELLSAIGNPEGFEASVRGLGATIARHHAFPDHHVFTADDLKGVGDEARPVLTTAKDAVKLTGVAGLWRLDVELELVRGGEVLAARLDALRPGRERRERAALHGGLVG